MNKKIGYRYVFENGKLMIDGRNKVNLKDLKNKIEELKMIQNKILIDGLINNADMINTDNIAMLKFEIFDAYRKGRNIII